MELLLAIYGYPLVLAGTFFEGESALVLAGFLARRGYLELRWVLVCALAGTFGAAQLAFHLGRTRGQPMLAKRPYWRARSARLLAILRGHEVAATLGFRFLFGLRTLGPLLLGLSGVAPGRFLTFNALGAVAWTAVFGLLGFLLGEVLEPLLKGAKRYETTVALAILGAGGLAWLVRWLLRRRRIRLEQRSA